MKRSILTFVLTLFCVITAAQSRADVNVLIIGSTRDSGEMHPANVWWSDQKPPQVPNSVPFLPADIGTQLQNILAQDGRGTVNVTVQERYASHAITNGWYAHSYNLATWFHYPYPAGAESNRWANLRGEAGTNWNYVVLIGDPYTMEYTPGMYAHGVAKVAEEVAKGGAETILLMPWPGSGSSSSINHYKEVVYRSGRSGGFKVAPAGLAWQASGLSNAGANPNANGAYIAASSIYSCIYTQSAKASAYVYNDGYADTAYNTFTNNNTASHYTGTFSFQNPYRILDDKMRHVRMSERGTSTEEGFKGKIRTAMTRSAVTYAEYNDSYTNNTPTATVWTTNPMPISFNYGRDGFYSEPEKSYVINPSYWQLGFGYYYQSGGSVPVETLNDMHIGLMQEQDNDLANRMIKEGSTARNIPTRSLWAQIHKAYPTLSPMRDTTHLSYNLDEAVGTYIYTIYSGRCPLDPKLATDADDIVWNCRRIGYETAWRVGRCQSRAPGFKVSPSAAAKKSIIPGEKETMKVEFILPPQQNVTVDISISNTNAAIVGSKQLVFTPQNYNVPQSVVVAGLPGSAASNTFNVVFSTVSSDEVCHGLSDTWDYSIIRSAPVTLTRVDKGTTQVTANQNLPVTINLNTAGSASSNTILAGPSRGTTTWSGSDVIYIPGSDFLGKDGFSFSTTNAGTLSVGYIDITVTNVVPSGKVSYRGNGAEGGAVPVDTNSYAQSATVTVLGNTGNLTRVGYNFNGWNTATNGSGTSYNAGATFVMGSSGVILYAKWISVPTYTVTYNANASTSGSVPWAQTKTDGVNLTLATNIGTLARNGYTFAGWNTLANGTGTDYAAGGTYSGNSNITLYAKWTPRNYTVTFNANGGGTPSPTSKVVTYASTYGTLAAVSYPGYTHNGWFTATNGGTRILESTTVTITANQTLYAQWTVGSSYTVSYNANGADSGTVPVDQTKAHDVELTLASNTGLLARTGYTFAGWNTAAEGSGTAYAAGASYTANAGAMFYAQWAGTATYTVSYNGNGNTGGSVPSNQTKTQGVALTLATNTGNLTKTGNDFAGWNTAANGSGQSFAPGEAFTLDQNTTLYARWNSPPVVDAGANQSIALSSAAASWSPAEIAPHAWYDANDATTIVASAGAVSEWRDKSGNSRHAIQSNPAKRPTTSTRTIGGLNALDFVASNDFDVTSFDFIGKECWTVINKDTTADFHVLGSSANIQVGVLSTGKMRIWPAYSADTQSTNLISVGSDYVLGFRALNPKKYSINGIEEVTANVPNGVLTINHIMENQYAHDSDGLIGEIVITAGELSIEDRQNMEGYLAHKWGQAGKLPGDHPHKDAAPGAPGAVANLNGTASDSEGDTVTTLWSVFSGPATVKFDDPTALQTTATFNLAGTYVLRLTADDGSYQVSDDVVVVVAERSTAYANWLVQYFGDSGIDDMVIASNGVNTIREAYIIGLNPTNATNQFVISGIEAPAGAMVVNWNSTSGRFYNVYWSTNLLGGEASFLLLRSNISWTANSFTNTEHSAEDMGFYRIDVQLE